MTLPKEIWVREKALPKGLTPNGYWEGREIPGAGKYVRADTHLVRLVVSSRFEAQAARERRQELAAENSRLRGIIAEMTFYDWTADTGAPNAPPDFFRGEVAQAIGFPSNEKENGNA